MIITRIAHCGLLIEHKNTRLLVDPLLVPSPKEAYRLNPEPSMSSSQVRRLKLDGLVISHSHADHFSIDTLRHLKKNIPVIIPKSDLRLAYFLHRLGFSNVIALSDFQKYSIGGVKITATPSNDSMPEMGILFETTKTNFWHTVDSVLSAKIIRLVKNRCPNLSMVSLAFRTFDYSCFSRAADLPDCDQQVLKHYLQMGKKMRPAQVMVLDQGWFVLGKEHINRKLNSVSAAEFSKMLNSCGVRSFAFPAGTRLNSGNTKRRLVSQQVFKLRSVNRSKAVSGTKHKGLSKLDSRILKEFKSKLVKQIRPGTKCVRVVWLNDDRVLQEWRVPSTKNCVSYVSRAAWLKVAKGLLSSDVLCLGGELRSVCGASETDPFLALSLRLFALAYRARELGETSIRGLELRP